MLQLRPWKIALVVIAAIIGIVFTLPNLVPASATAGWPGLFKQRLNLGLDLQGGSYLLLEVDTVALQNEKLNNIKEDVRRDLAAKAIDFSGLGVVNGAVHVRVNDPAKLDAAQTELQKLAQPISAQSGQRNLAVSKGPDQTLVLTPAAESAGAEASKAVDQTIEIIRRRIDSLGTREPTIIKQGLNRIVVEAPGESDPERLKAVIGKTAKLSFQMVDDSVTAAEVAASRPPPGSELVASTEQYDPQGVVVRKRVVVSGEDLLDASQGFKPDTGAPIINFRFNGRGAKAFAEATGNNIGKRFAIILDGKSISAPRINGAIPGGQGYIEGNFTQESASDMALLLRSGALPAPSTVQEQRTVSAELGADAVKTGAISLGIGAVAIIVFIVLAYGLCGVFAAIALIVNVLLLIGILSVTQATLTLPGVAGLILKLAVAVDANVLIYERMRDEERSGRTPLIAADHGFRRALVSIIDANVTTLISAAIMFQFCTGPVRGFAWTLSVGVLTSLFTAIFITQVLIGWWFRAAKPKKLPI
ncbi:protein translocase subunit SecD [soil metagenome]